MAFVTNHGAMAPFQTLLYINKDFLLRNQFIVGAALMVRAIIRPLFEIIAGSCYKDQKKSSFWRL